MKKDLYQFTGVEGTFIAQNPNQCGGLYFPLVNEQGLMSSITPDLAGDVKLDQHTFLNLPATFEDLHLSRASRNFWLTFQSKKIPLWSVTGRSVWQRVGTKEESTTLEAGLLWQKVTRKNKKLGIEATVLSFIPARDGAYEIMQVQIKNISRRPLRFIATSAIPLFGRSADNLRDHRHVTSLLHRLTKEQFGIRLCPTMSFNERGHLINHTSYYVLGADDLGRPPAGIYPTLESFAGPDGDLEKPWALLSGQKPHDKVQPSDQGKEAIGALQFRPTRIKAGGTATFTLLIGIDKEIYPNRNGNSSPASQDVPRLEKINKMLEETKQYWDGKISTIRFHTGDDDFNAWIRWVQTQPILRKLFGCSFLPDFDYGRGGRGWRDLWQDCLALLLQSPEDVRDDIIHNFGGVRIDGSNATIIGRKKIGQKWIPEFVADRNNISRTWMDHGVWPFLTMMLYLNQTGDWAALLEKVPYFRDALIHRARKVDPLWKRNDADERVRMLKTMDGAVYQGSVLEHILVQTLVQFFNVGEHNIIRLEDADWNDGLDMAHARGESVAFTSMYGGNLGALADLLETLAKKAGWTTVQLAKEVGMLLDRVGDRVNYDSVHEKTNRLTRYFEAVARELTGSQIAVPIDQLANDLREKSDWIKNQINQHEWLIHAGHSWYNGYYDNTGERVEGLAPDGHLRMTLSGQVYPIMAGLADPQRIESVVHSVDTYLFDKKLGGVRLNTDFGAPQPNLGRAFSFVYGEKENGAVFSHMAVMYANALYQRGFAKDGYRILNSLFEMAKKSDRSRIFPGLPEYFNNEGRGRYMYLTGSASWYVLTLLTQAFGVRGFEGDLLLAPKLEPAQFDKKGRASVSIRFAESLVSVTYVNPKRVAYDQIRIKNVYGDNQSVNFTRISEKEVVVKREIIKQKKEWKLEVELS